jgi:hypothetical protein
MDVFINFIFNKQIIIVPVRACTSVGIHAGLSELQMTSPEANSDSPACSCLLLFLRQLCRNPLQSGPKKEEYSSREKVRI